MSESAAFKDIPFDDDADEVKTWKGLALSAIMDLRRYAHDAGPERRMVSAEAYEADAERIHAHAPSTRMPDASKVLLTGRIMANAMYNLSQRGEMTDDIRSQMRIMQQEWDKAAAEYRATAARSTAISAAPVAWQCRNLYPDAASGGWYQITQATFNGIVRGQKIGLYAGCEARPLYAAPTTSPEQQALERISSSDYDCIGEDGDQSGTYNGVHRKDARQTTSPEPDAVREALDAVFRDHYWDSFEADKALILQHVKDVLDYSFRYMPALSRPAHGGWEDISTAPKDADNIDLWCRNISHGSTDQARFTGMFINCDGKWEDWHGYVLEPKWRPTHWKRPDAGPIPRNDRGGSQS